MSRHAVSERGGKVNRRAPGLCSEVAEMWESWCGETKWSKSLRKFGDAGGRVIWWSGYPRSASAIPLCFSLFLDGKELNGGSRLKDIRAAIAKAEGEERGAKG